SHISPKACPHAPSCRVDVVHCLRRPLSECRCRTCRGNRQGHNTHGSNRSLGATSQHESRSVVGYGLRKFLAWKSTQGTLEHLLVASERSVQWFPRGLAQSGMGRGGSACRRHSDWVPEYCCVVSPRPAGGQTTIGIFRSRTHLRSYRGSL